MRDLREAVCSGRGGVGWGRGGEREREVVGRGGTAAQECLCGDGERRRAGMRPTIPTVSEPSQQRFPSYLFSPRPPSIAGPVCRSTDSPGKMGGNKTKQRKKTHFYLRFHLGLGHLRQSSRVVRGEKTKERRCDKVLIGKRAWERSARPSLG